MDQGEARAYVRAVSAAVRSRLPLIYDRAERAPAYALELLDCCRVRSIIERAVAIAGRLGIDGALPIVLATPVDDVADFWERVFVELLHVSGPAAVPYKEGIAEDIAQDLGAVIAYSARRRADFDKNYCKYPNTRAPFPEYQGGRRREALEAWQRPLTSATATSYALSHQQAVEALRSANHVRGGAGRGRGVPEEGPGGAGGGGRSMRPEL